MPSRRWGLALTGAAGFLYTAVSSGAPAEPVSAAIRAEAVRPNGDPEGRPLPLASRWTVHNFAGADMVGPGEPAGVHWPFHLDRLLDEIDAGHHILPFVNWNIGEGGGYTVTAAALEPGFRRLARTGLPFEFVAGNLEDEMFATPESAARYWHLPMEENPAHIRADNLGVAAKTAPGASVVRTSGWAPRQQVVGERGFVIFAGHGHVYPLAAPAVSDADGVAALALAEPLRARVEEGETVAEVRRKMDFWSASPEAVWEQAGRDLASSPARERLARIYPDPPYVAVVSNNEGGGKVGIADAKASWHCRQRLRRERGASEASAFAAGYVRNMGAYLRGIKRGLPWPEERSKAIGYNAFGANFELGRWGGWSSGLEPLGAADFFTWLAWDGSAPDFYCYDWNYATDEHVGSPHVGSMQAFAMLAPRAEAQVPGYQWQIALWDGGAKKRYAYAAWGELPATRDLGTVTTAIESTGAHELRIDGAQPNAMILRQGDMFSIEGHSEYLPARCAGVFDKVSIPGADPGAIGLFEASADVGFVELAGEAGVVDEGYAVIGAGENRWSERQGWHFLWRTLPAAGKITARVLAMDNPDAGLQTAQAAWVPDSPGATYVDPALTGLVTRLAGSASGAQAGVMLRASNQADDAFVFVCRQPAGRVWMTWRDRRGGAMQSLDAPVTVPETRTWLRIERDKDSWAADYSLDGREWKALKTVVAALGPKPLVGLASTAANSRHSKMRLYTAAADVRSDGRGRAVIPLGDHPESGPTLVNAHHRPIRRGARVRFHDYLDRYEGLCHAALWLTRPRVIREFGWGDYNGVVERQWTTLLGAVDRVWNDPVLARFWRKGRLVVNPDYEAATGLKHPFWELTDIDKEGRVGPWLALWKKQDRFHQLTVPINPPFEKWPQRYEVASRSNPWAEEDSLIKVWAFAYELGEAPGREWLVFVQSPREDRKAVPIIVPGYGDVTVDAPRRGAFYHLEEGDRGGR